MVLTVLNDAPAIGGDGAITVAEGGSVVIAVADLTATDVDNTDAQLAFSVTATSRGTVLLNGSAATSFTKADLIAGVVSFQHDGSEADGSFSVSVSDGTAQVTGTVSATVDPHVNDPTPAATSGGVTAALEQIATGGRSRLHRGRSRQPDARRGAGGDHRQLRARPGRAGVRQDGAAAWATSRRPTTRRPACST